MVANIKDLKTGLSELLPESFKKVDVLDSFKRSNKFLKSNQELIKEVSAIVADADIKNFPLLKGLMSYNGIKADKVGTAINFLSGILEILDNNSKEVEKAILDIPDVNVSNNIILRAGVVYVIVSDYFLVNKFITKLLNNTLDIFSNDFRYKEIDTSDLNLMNNELDFYKITKAFSDDKDFGKNIKDKYPEIIVEINSSDSDSFLDVVVKKIKGTGIINLLSSGFKNNPLYWIGKLYIDYQIDSANVLKDEQDKLRFKIIEIQSLNAEGKIENDKMEKMIKKLNEDIDKKEYKIIRLLGK